MEKTESALEKMVNKEKAVYLYQHMLRIRMVEQEIANRYNGEIREMHTPIHLCDGQEAVAVGVCSNLEVSDIIFSTHRCHGHYLAKGGDLVAMIAELHTKETGCCHGMGGSMHLTDKEAGVGVSSAIVGGNVSIATGYALALKQQRKNNVSVVFLGDGASEEGSVYESICFARIHNLPVLYVCENNLYAISTDFSTREPLQTVSDKFRTIVETKVIDGNNVFEVAEVSDKIISNMKSNKSGPFFLECNTYRLRDHHNVNIGVSSGYRSQEEWDKWNNYSPIKNAQEKLRKNRWMSEADEKVLKEQINQEIQEAFRKAHEAPLPSVENMSKYLWG